VFGVDVLSADRFVADALCWWWSERELNGRPGRERRGVLRAAAASPVGGIDADTLCELSCMGVRAGVDMESERRLRLSEAEHDTERLTP
jgi:hypothetical protein